MSLWWLSSEQLLVRRGRLRDQWRWVDQCRSRFSFGMADLSCRKQLGLCGGHSVRAWFGSMLMAPALASLVLKGGDVAGWSWEVFGHWSSIVGVGTEVA